MAGFDHNGGEAAPGATDRLQAAMCATAHDLLAALEEANRDADDMAARLAFLTTTMEAHPQATCADVLDWYAAAFVFNGGMWR